eukprot:Em0059g10a
MVSDGDTDEYSYLRAVKELNHPQGDPVTGSGRYRHSSLSLRQSTLEGAEVEPPPRAACHYDSPPWRVKRLNHPQGDPVTGSGRYRHSSMSLQQSTLEGEEVEPPPRAACHYDSPPWRVKRLNHPQGDPVAGSGRYRHSSMSLQQSTLEGEEVEPPPRAACHYDSPPWRVKRLNHPQGDPVAGSGRYRHSSMSLQQSTLEGEEVEPPPRAACHYDSPPWRVKRLNHPQGDPVAGSGRYRHSSMSLRQSTLEGEEVEPPPRSLKSVAIQSSLSLRQSTLEGEEVEPSPRAACHYDSPPWRVKRLNHPQGDPVTGSGRYRHSSMSLQQSTLEGEEVEPPPRAACHYDSPPWRVKRLNHPQGDPVTGSGRYRHSSMSLRRSTLEGEEVEPPPRAACHYDSPPWRVKRLNHPQGDPVAGSGRYRHSSMSLQQSTLEGEEVEPPPRAACHYNSPPWRVKRLNHPQGDPVTGSGRYRHSSMSLQQSTLEGEEVETTPRAACHYNSPPWRVKRLNHPQGDPVAGSGRYRHSSMSLQQSTLEGEEVEPPPRAACHYDSPPWRVKRLNHPQGDPVTGSGRYRHSSLSLRQSTLEGEEVEPPPRAACHYDSPPWRVKRLNHPQGDPVAGSGRYRHSSMSLQQSTLEGEEVEPPPRAACHYNSPPWRVKRLNHPQGDPVTGSGRYRHSSMSLQQSTLEGEEVEPPQGDPVTGSGRYRHSSMSLQQSTLEGEEVEPPPRAACHYDSPPWRVKRLNHPQGDPVAGSGRYRHTSMSLQQSTLEGEEVEPPPRAACHYDSPPWRVKRLNHPQGDPVAGSGRYRHSSMSLQQSTLEGEEVEPPQGDPVTGSGRYRHSSLSLRQSTLEGEEVEPSPRAACHYDSPPWRVKRLNHPQGDPVTGSGRYRHSSMSLQQSTLEGEEVEPPPRAACHYDSPPWRVKRLNHPQGDPVAGSGRYRHSSMSLQQSTLEGEEVEPPPRAACHYNSPPWRVKRLNHPQGDPVTGSGRYRHSSMSLQQSTLEGEEVEPPQGDPVTGSGRYRHSSMSLQQSTLEGEEVEPPPRAACHYNSPPWRVKRLNHPQGDPVAGSGRYRHMSHSVSVKIWN